MSITLREMQDRIWTFLNKSRAKPGYYTEAKVNQAIQETLDYIAVKMFVAGEGWLTEYIYADTSSDEAKSQVAIPTDVALIREIRYKDGSIYVPLTYDDQVDSASYVGSEIQQYAGRWRMLGTNIVFDPPMAEGGADYLQMEVVKYPEFPNDVDKSINQQFDNAMLRYMKYKSCSILSASIEKEIRTWGQEEAEAFADMQTVVTRRNLKSTRVREFL